MATQLGVNLNTESERLIYKYYESEKTQRKKLEELVNQLNSQVAELQRKLELRERNNAPSETPRKVVIPPPAVYETDEEELAQETEWVRQKSRKKRRLNKSPSPEPTTVNEKPKVKKSLPPPPIIVDKIDNYQRFYDLLLGNAKKEAFIIKMLKGGTAKINVYDDDTYRAITKLLSLNKYMWYSYENKQNRPIRVMAKNLHSSCSPDRIVEDLTLKGFKIESAVNKLSWRNKDPLNMFLLAFQKEEDIKKIYEIKSILGCKVDIEPIKTSKLLPQCKRCQAYGHTQKYCSKEARCVKCTGKHLTIECTKAPEAKPKCVHCGEPHPANYRGCTVAKELQKIKNKLLAKKNEPTSVNQATSKITEKTKSSASAPTRHVIKNVSYAQIAQDSELKPQPQLKPSQGSAGVDEKLSHIINLMTSFDERLKKLESSAKSATIKHKK